MYLENFFELMFDLNSGYIVLIIEVAVKIPSPINSYKSFTVLQLYFFSIVFQCCFVMTFQGVLDHS